MVRGAQMRCERQRLVELLQAKSMAGSGVANREMARWLAMMRWDAAAYANRYDAPGPLGAYIRVLFSGSVVVITLKIMRTTRSGIRVCLHPLQRGESEI